MTHACPYCNGTGRIYVELGSSQRYACTDCGGKGRIEDNVPDLECDDDRDDDDECSEPSMKSPSCS